MNCPKCGGSEGYFFRLLVAYNSHCDWQGNPVNAEHTFEDGRNEGNLLECVECGARFRRSTIEKLRDA